MPVPLQLAQSISTRRLPLHFLHGTFNEPLPEHLEQGVEKANWVLCPLQRGHVVPSARVPFASQRAQGPAFWAYVPLPEHFRQLTTIVPRLPQKSQSPVKRPVPSHLRHLTPGPVDPSGDWRFSESVPIKWFSTNLRERLYRCWVSGPSASHLCSSLCIAGRNSFLSCVEVTQLVSSITAMSEH